MSHIYKASEWQNTDGTWHVADVTDLANDSAVWWIPALIFGVTQQQYLEMLVEKYHVSHLHFGKILIFSWNNYADAHKYLLDINKIARTKQIKIC